MRPERILRLSSRAGASEPSVLAGGIVRSVGASVELVVVEFISAWVLFEKISRLKASTPLSVAGVRGMLEEEEDEAALELARKGFSVGMVGAVLVIGVVD